MRRFTSLRLSMWRAAQPFMINMGLAIAMLGAFAVATNAQDAEASAKQGSSPFDALGYELVETAQPTEKQSAAAEIVLAQASTLSFGPGSAFAEKLDITAAPAPAAKADGGVRIGAPTVAPLLVKVEAEPIKAPADKKPLAAEAAAAVSTTAIDLKELSVCTQQIGAKTLKDLGEIEGRISGLDCIEGANTKNGTTLSQAVIGEGSNLDMYRAAVFGEYTKIENGVSGLPLHRQVIFLKGLLETDHKVLFLDGKPCPGGIQLDKAELQATLVKVEAEAKRQAEAAAKRVAERRAAAAKAAAEARSKVNTAVTSKATIRGHFDSAARGELVARGNKLYAVIDGESFRVYKGYASKHVGEVQFAKKSILGKKVKDAERAFKRKANSRVNGELYLNATPGAVELLKQQEMRYNGSVDSFRRIILTVDGTEYGDGATGSATGAAGGGQGGSSG